MIQPSQASLRALAKRHGINPKTVAKWKKRTIKEATVKRYHYDSHRQLETHLHDFIDAYNDGRRLKTLKGLTPFEYICKTRTIEPERFKLNPTHQSPGLKI